jgi:CMP-N,N'-diacetyllegionaminic acid synthase
MKVLALIPARSGSKSIKDKNIRLINGKPLLAYSIQHALESKLINRVIISTDSNKYGRIAKKYGAEFPFLRPADISGDQSTDLEVFSHALTWLKENEEYVPDICVHLRPTYPLRQSEDIDKMTQLLIDHPKIDAVRTIAPSPETPYKMWFRDNDGLIAPVIRTTIKDAYNEPRKNLQATYLQNACIDVIRTATIIEKKSMTGDIIYGYLMEHNWDIDYMHQLKKVRKKT